MDERIGTNIARQRGLQTIGLVGILIKAKNQNIIAEIGLILTELKETAGFWLSDNLEKRILQKVGEIK